jgi:capsular polysaccharide export protein
MTAIVPLIRIPPFPGSRPRRPCEPGSLPARRSGTAEVKQVIAMLARERVGGCYWGSQPQMPAAGYVLVAVKSADTRDRVCKDLRQRQAVYVHDAKVVCDPWHLVKCAAEVIVDADDELAVVAASVGLPVRCVGEGPYGSVATQDGLKDAVETHVLSIFYTNPFTGERMSAVEALELSAFWRRQIDANRAISGALGIAAWKRETVGPLLWAGPGTPRFGSSGTITGNGEQVVIWRSKCSRAAIAKLERKGVDLVEIEDGFIRSIGLGADCVPPLSVIVDRLGIYFDASRPSDLEVILESGSFSPDLIAQAKALRALIVERGISKYAAGVLPAQARRSSKRSILVTGQVEDDRAVLEGGMGLASNLELLKRVRERAPEAYIIYKPHPDVEAGHRRGAIPNDECRELADEVVRDGSISWLIDAVDEVHVNTSLAGFEALLRCKPVATYGVPFYAGWGLTTDYGAVPARRTARRSLDELVAAALILYPRYLDPDTGLPCPAEVLVRRLAEGHGSGGARPLIWLRRLQGRLRRKLANVANG